LKLKVFLPVVLGLALLALVGCQAQPQQLFIEVDRGRQAVTTDAPTVRDALEVAGVSLNALDRVSPDLYVETEPGMVIVVTRVEEQFETTRVLVPFERKTVTNEALPTGETRLIQLGVNGEDEITQRITLEDGIEVERIQVSRVPVIEPVDEIIAVGAQDELEPAPIEGSVAYLSAGNAWVMRDTSTARRPLTTEGDLDSRVFELSPDGRWLLYSRRLEGDIETPINQLWLVNTTIVGEKPISTPIQGVLYAEWSPDGDQIAYSTAERTPSAPGWRANNDLWLVRAVDVFTYTQESITATQVISPSTAGVYSWWGTTFEWSPDGRQVAYARPDQIGVVDIISQTDVVLADFAAYQTYSEWVWVPSLTWSPDSRYLAAAVHAPPINNESNQESPAFDLWFLAADGSVKARIADQVGMWTSPSWGTEGVVYGQAVNPLRSVDSRYALYLRDRDGSNPRQLFPVAEEPGVEPPPQVAWSPNGKKFIFVYNGNLYLADTEGAPPKQLTSNNQSGQPRWAAGRTEREFIELRSTPAITSTTPVTASDVLTPTGDIQ
jgi:Tol biopolymer transport system component